MTTETPRTITARLSRGDRVYRAVTTSAAATVLVTIVLITVFLVLTAIPAIQRAGWSFFTTTAWNPDEPSGRFGIAAMMYGTAVTGLIAMVFTVPISIATAVFINEYAPRALKGGLTTAVEVMAAIPSIIFAGWGLHVLIPFLDPMEKWAVDHLGGVFFVFEAREIGSSFFNVGLVISLMAIPITTSIMRAVLAQAPRHECEGALALGATRWGMVRTVVLPFGRGGMIGASMLGLGRALGETMAATLIFSFAFEIKPRLFENGGVTIASGIAIYFKESRELGLSALMAAGAALFLVTFVINLLAARVVDRAERAAR
ncbi:phosphate ABC transporter permease subunit PstC [Spongiactinospora sp. 9N601]|uniref:phosphate ABC transporter permease subunit PstC n=1 Tax=Spongiactinospora sp. 9N601 TaxID=3375149 RepID=UPI0037985B79